jgi:DNA-binding CsgD family transcriptional regulator
MSNLYETLETIVQQSTADNIMVAVNKIVQAVGFDVFSYYTLRYPQTQPPLRNNYTYPESWIDRYYNENHNIHDVTILRAGSTTLPFTWQVVRDDTATSLRQRKIFNEASEFGLTHGVSIPIHGPDNELSLLSVAGRMSQKQFDTLWSENKIFLTLFGSYVLEARLKVRNVGLETAVSLTDRERECLTWTAQGKTSWEVSRILKISEKTVLFHLANVLQKLSVHSKHHAVVKALVSGLIQP